MSNILGENPWVGLRGAIGGITSTVVYLFTYKKLTEENHESRMLSTSHSGKHLIAFVAGLVTMLCFIAPGLAMNDSEEKWQSNSFDEGSDGELDDLIGAALDLC